MPLRHKKQTLKYFTFSVLLNGWEIWSCHLKKIDDDDEVTLLWDMIRRPWVAGCRNFKAVYCSHLQASRSLFFDISILQYVASKCCDLITEGGSVVSQKKGIPLLGNIPEQIAEDYFGIYEAETCRNDIRLYLYISKVQCWCHEWTIYCWWTYLDLRRKK
jgi:hypothetical protein